MIELADEFFQVKNDPEQISVDEAVRSRLKLIHPRTMNEKRTKDGPVAWVLIIPTTHGIMKKFLSKKITEKELLELTPLRTSYDAIYLCSALVLPEYRGKGLAVQMTGSAVRAIMKKHPVKHLFYWAFSIEGRRVARSVAVELALPLHRRKE
jgi:GNAT superfamily N-acetyltransferase